MEEPYISGSGRSFYDLGNPSTDPFPPNYYLGFLSQSWVQSALGVPVNFTESSNSVYTAFYSIGDIIRGSMLQDLAFVLDSGVKVALVYGDRDFACNWIGGENVSLNIPWSQQQNFRSAGYTDLQVNSSYVGGKTRQYGNLSFTRVYQSGHEVPAYQPETAWQIFQRALSGLDIATGANAVTAGYSTQGPADTWNVQMKAPAAHPSECYVLNLATCTNQQVDAIINGSVPVNDYIYGQTASSTSSSSGSGSSSSPKKSDASWIYSSTLEMCLSALIPLLLVSSLI